MFDIVLVLAAVSAAIGGYRLGFVARSASWIGFGLGVVGGALLLPEVLPQVQDASEGTIALVSIGLLVGMALIGNALGLVLGTRLHAELPAGAVRRTDQVAGGVIGVVGLLVILWLLLPTLAYIPGWMSTQARGSVIAREVNERFPDAPDTLAALRTLVGDDPFPEVFDALRPAPDPGASPGSSGLSTELANQVAGSTVKIEGVACSRVQEGSGFFVDENLVVTNAHVVAGVDDPTVELFDGATAGADVVAFDPDRDLAVLRTRGAGRAPLPLRDAAVGDTGGVFGRPGGGPLEISPFRVGDEITAVGRDIYGSASTSREVLVLASQLAPGDSGSALVDPQGQVVGVAFAVAPDDPDVAYALSIDELEAVLGGDLSAERDTGGCLA
ncbi:MAG: MarP family serine protease [Acidimicrobiales bacterium]|nr:MarP family serine protease [Acidimicrobiales bacterium]